MNALLIKREMKNDLQLPPTDWSGEPVSSLMF